MLQNGSFTEGWETLPALPEAGYLRNQRPNGWQLTWLNKGQPLYDDPNSQAQGVPECVHKLGTQLPPHEQRGMPNALILVGDTTYKIFNSGAAFGAALSQTVTGLQPGTQAVLTVPIQVHLHGESDEYGAESSVWVNDEGEWVNGRVMGDRKWYRHKVEFTVPANGEAEIVIRVKSKWNKPKDFFFDGIVLEAEQATSGDITDDTVVDNDDAGGETAVPVKTIYLQLPAGVQLRQGESSQPNVVEINLPPGVTVEIV